MTLTDLAAEKLVIREIRGNGFVHGLPLDAFPPPTAWCRTTFPSLLCTCGACVLLWDGYAALVATGEQLYAWPTTLHFVHADDPATGEGPLCATASQAMVCPCGRFLLQWDDLGALP